MLWYENMLVSWGICAQNQYKYINGTQAHRIPHCHRSCAHIYNFLHLWCVPMFLTAYNLVLVHLFISTGDIK